MKAIPKPAKSVDAYIAGFPPEIREILRKLRLAVRECAPGAEETISYGIPTFKLRGNLVHFAAYGSHIGFYPTSSAIKAFKKELAPYELGKGTVRFPVDRPIPFGLVKRIVKYRVREVLEKA